MEFFASSYLFISSRYNKIHKRGVKKSLRRNAANVQARTTKSTTLFNASRLQSHLGSLDRCYIATRTSSDDNDIESNTVIPTGEPNLSAAAALKHLAAIPQFLTKREVRYIFSMIVLIQSEKQEFHRYDCSGSFIISQEMTMTGFYSVSPQRYSPLIV